MKILTLDIKGFRSLKDIHWTPGDINLIFGANSTGKSNLLQTLHIIQSSAKGNLAESIQKVGGLENLLWEGQAPKLEFDLRTTPFGDVFGPDHYNLSIVSADNQYSYKIQSETLANYSKMKFLERKINTAVLYGEEAQIDMDIDPETYIVEEESFLSLCGSPFIDNFSVPPFQRALENIAVYQHLGQADYPFQAWPEKKISLNAHNFFPVLYHFYTNEREFKVMIDKAMRCVYKDFRELSFQRLGKNYIQGSITWKTLKREYPFQELSNGIIRLLFILTLLGLPEKPPIVAIDRIEAGISPELFPLLAELASQASNRCQIIATTYNLDLLRAFAQYPQTSLTYTQFTKGSTQIQNISGSNLDAQIKDCLDWQDWLNRLA